MNKGGDAFYLLFRMEYFYFFMVWIGKWSAKTGLWVASNKKPKHDQGKKLHRHVLLYSKNVRKNRYYLYRAFFGGCFAHPHKKQ